jgi:hypothetical protein
MREHCGEKGQQQVFDNHFFNILKIKWQSAKPVR